MRVNARRIVMKTIILEQPGHFVLTDTQPPAAPGAGEVLVRVRRVGICGTDLHAFRGRQPFFQYPRVLGHELAVEVVGAGDAVEGVSPGDRCAVNPYMNCGQCGACRRGKTNCCERLKVLGVHVDGGMRDQIVLPGAHLYPSAKLNLDQLALVETLGIGAHAVMRSGVERRERVLVIGAGPIGLSVIEFLRIAGAEIALLEIDGQRRAFCQQTYGITECYASADEAVASALKTAIFDCTGSKASMEAAPGYVANGGKLIFVGLFSGDFSLNDPEFHRREITLLASRNATPVEHLRIVELIEAGTIDTKPWISDRAPAGEMIDRFPRWLDRDQGVVKAIVDWDR